MNLYIIEVRTISGAFLWKQGVRALDKKGAFMEVLDTAPYDLDVLSGITLAIIDEKEVA